MGVQRTFMILFIVVGIVFLIQGSNQEEPNQGMLLTMVGAFSLICGGMFMMLQFGFKVGGKIGYEMFCKCSSTKLGIYGLLLLIVCMIMIMVSVMSSVGSEDQQQGEQEEEDNSGAVLLWGIILGSIGGVLCLCSAYMAHGP